MANTELSPREQALFTKFGRSFFTAAEEFGFDREEARRLLDKNTAFGRDIAGVMAGIYFIDRCASSGYRARSARTAKLRIEGVEDLKSYFYERQGKWYVRSKNVLNLLVEFATTDSDLKVRLAAVDALPHAFGRPLRQMIFFRNNWRGDQDEAVVQAVIKKLRKGRHTEGLKLVAFIGPFRFGFSVLKDLDEEVVAEVARRSRIQETAKAAANRVENYELLEQVFNHSRWVSAKTIARRKLYPERK